MNIGRSISVTRTVSSLCLATPRSLSSWFGAHTHTDISSTYVLEYPMDKKEPTSKFDKWTLSLPLGLSFDFCDKRKTEREGRLCAGGLVSITVVRLSGHVWSPESQEHRCLSANCKHRNQSAALDQTALPTVGRRRLFQDSSASVCSE